jgi:predicted DsbA family dithiol-disulfide isomerase
MKVVPIVYFSDILCIWAHIAQLRLDALERTFGDQVVFERRFCSVFGDTARKVATSWAAKGGYEGFNAHLRESAAQFPEIRLNPEIWLSVRPASSMGAHAFLKSVQLTELAGESPQGATDRILRAFRRAFFEDARDISRREVHVEIAGETGLALELIDRRLASGEAFAALASDMQDASTLGIQGSPSFVLNEGRQKLYGNVGFRVIEANIREMLRTPAPDQASWC